MKRRLAVFAFDRPYPPHRGGQADIWRRLLALKHLGHAVHLVAWHGAADAPSPAEQEMLSSAVDGLSLFSTRQGGLEALRRLAGLPWWPSHVASRRLGASTRQALHTTLARFAPDAVWCEGPYPSVEAQAAAGRLRLPLFVRSHNIEHLYMKRQAAAARSPRDRLAWRLACIGLERYERKLLHRADWVYDVSCDDLSWWQHQGLQRASWLPPLADAALRGAPAPTAAAPTPVDLLFLGNLSTPNNRRGVEWLLREVAPRLWARHPGLRIRVAGSRPEPAMRELCAQVGVDLLSDPPDAWPVLRAARVLVNPVATGSGTQLKTIEMLFTDAAIVSTPQGVQGLPGELKGLISVADTPEAFAAACLQALDHPVAAGGRGQARRMFSLGGFEAALRKGHVSWT